MRTEVRTGHRTVDAYETPFGVRQIHFDAREGFMLNGETVILKGMCNHHDLGPLGAALWDQALARRRRMLKEMGCNQMSGVNESGFANLLDTVGYNGGGGSCFQYIEDHERYPNRIFYASEVPHTYQTRGEYRTHSRYRDSLHQPPNLTAEEIFPETHPKYHSAYDNAGVRISARDSWRLTRDLPFVAGEYRWTGFDYLGESGGWPRVIGNFGIIDICNFPKDTYFFYQSQWTERPMVHVLPHWTWPGKEGTVIPVWAYTNCDSVELSLNGKTLGTRTFTTGSDMHLSWDVPYQPGELKVVAKTDGQVVCTTVTLTAGSPARVVLAADQDTLVAGRPDLSYVTIKIVDKHGHFNATAEIPVTLELQGPGRILGIGNGDPLNSEGYQGQSIKSFNGLCLAIIGSTDEPGDIVLAVKSEGLASGTVTLRSVVQEKSGAVTSTATSNTQQQRIIESKCVISAFKSDFTAPPERTPFRSSVDGPLLGNGDMGVVMAGNPEEQRFVLCKNDMWRLQHGYGNASPVPFGHLAISIPALKDASYKVAQDLCTATTEGVFELNGSAVTIKSFVAATENVLVLELTAKGKSFTAFAALHVAEGRGSDSTSHKQGNLFWGKRAFTRDVDVPSGVAAAWKLLDPNETPYGDSFVLKPGKPLSLVLAMDSIFKHMEYENAVKRCVRSIDKKRLADIKAAHTQWWADYYAKSYISISDPVIEKQYYLSLYGMGSCSRDPNFPPSIFGWTTHDHPAWHGDYHLNYNH